MQMYQHLYKASPVMCHAFTMEVARRIAAEHGPAAADDVRLKLVRLGRRIRPSGPPGAVDHQCCSPSNAAHSPLTSLVEYPGNFSVCGTRQRMLRHVDQVFRCHGVLASATIVRTPTCTRVKGVHIGRCCKQKVCTYTVLPRQTHCP